MVARVLFLVLTFGATRSHPHHRATIKALPATLHHPIDSNKMGGGCQKKKKEGNYFQSVLTMPKGVPSDVP
jgi:hypothetical protein